MARASSVDSTWIGELSANVSIGGSTLTLASVVGTNWPSGTGIFGVQVGEDQDDDAELVQVTRSGSTLTLDASTLAKAHTAGVNIYYLTTAADINAKANDADVVHDTGNETVAGDKVWTGDNTWNGASNTFNSIVTLAGVTEAYDLSAHVLKQYNALVTAADWVSAIMGATATFVSTNNRTAVQTVMTVDTDLSAGGLTPSATTYAVNSNTGEVVAITGFSGGTNPNITRGRLTGIGAAAAAAITAGDTWYVLPYGYYAIELGTLYDSGYNFDVLQFGGHYVWMPVTVNLADPTTYNMPGRSLQLVIDGYSEFNGAPATVAYPGGSFTADFDTLTSGYKSMHLAAAPSATDYMHIGAY